MGKKFPCGLKRNSPLTAVLGIAIALLSLLMWGVWFPENKVILLLALFFAVILIVLGFVKITTATERAAAIINILWGLVAVAVVLGAMLPLKVGSNYLFIILLNYFCAMLMAAVVFVVTASWKTSINATIVILMILALINNMVLAYRGKEFGPLDILSAKTALSVAPQYTFQMTRRLLVSCFAFLAAFLSQFSLPRMPEWKGSKFYLRLGASVATVIMLLTVVFGSTDIPVRHWSNEGSQFNGFLLNFYISIRESKLDDPEFYSVAAMDAYAEQYNADADTIPSGENMPNIIVIMNESFSDLRIFNGTLATNIPVTPFIDSLSENTIKGYALTSTYGGGTPNVEFEFLTGHSMAFLPQNSIPYQQYITERMYSIPYLLKAYGYSTIATDPYKPTGWSRNVILPILGFDTFTSMNDYPREKFIREYISDQEMMEYVLDCLYTKGDKPLFLMGISMQNHGGYEYDGADFKNTITLEGYSGHYPRAEQYLSLIHETDRTVDYLLTELEKYEKDTIVLFFGDHLPGVEKELLAELNGSQLDTLEERRIQHTVPFFIWANYDIPSEFVECTSVNYLSLYLLENAGFELPAYHRAMKDIQEVIPAINAFGYYSLEKHAFVPFEDASGQEAQMLEMYENLQYNNLMDTQNRNEAFFSQYLK